MKYVWRISPSFLDIEEGEIVCEIERAGRIVRIYQLDAALELIN